MHDDMQSQQPMSQLPTGEVDREGAMARADLYKLANYSLKLFKKIHDEDQLEAWVQAKITKAADYVASVYHYLEYEMKFSEYGEHLANAEVYSESQQLAIKNKLMEAKEKVKELKKAQAEKVKESMVIGAGKEETCPHCGGAGHVVNPGKEVPAHVQDKVEKYKRLTKATHAAHKRMDANGDGKVTPEEKADFEKMDENAFDRSKGEMKVGDTKKTRTGQLTKTSSGVVHKNTSYADDGEAEQKSGKGVKSHAKSQSAAEKANKAPALKKSKTGTWGMENGEKFDNRKTNEALKGGQKKLDVDDDGDIEADDLADLRAKKNKKVEEAKKSPKAKKDWDKDGKVESEKDEVIGSRRKAAGLDEAKKEKEPEGTYSSKRHETDGQRIARLAKEKRQAQNKERMKNDYNAEMERESIEEAKPSAGLSKGQKSATVKDAKAGKDIGKPGKNFDKLAKKAGGGEKGEKIAAAAMWKNKAKAMSESLDALLETDMQGRLDQSDNELVKLAGFAAEKDPQGFQAAAAKGGEALAQYLGEFAQKQAGAQPVTAPAPTATAPAPEQAETEKPEALAESADMTRMKQLMTRLNG